MNGAQELAKLDRLLATRGTDMLLRRGGVAAELAIRARKTGYTPNELVGAVTQQSSVLIVSPSAWVGKNWPAAGSKAWMPAPGDTIRSHGVNMIVQAASADWMGDIAVRIYVVVRGATG